MTDQNPFQALKNRRRTEPAVSSLSSDGPCFFQVKQDGFRWYVETCDRALIPGDFHDYACRGAEAQALAVYNRLKQTTYSRWQIEWGKNHQLLYLQDHPELTDLLLSCENLLGFDGTPVTYSSASAALRLSGELHEGALACRVLLYPAGAAPTDQFALLTPALVLAGGVIYRISPVPAFDQLPLFNCTVELHQAQQLYSLCASIFPGIGIDHLDYTAASGGPIQAKPTIVLDQVDAAGALHLRVLVTADVLDPEFLHAYDITTVALIYDQTNMVQLCQLTGGDRETAARDVEKRLKSCGQPGSGDHSYVRIDELFIIQKELTQLFLERELPDLLSVYTLLGSEKLSAYRMKMTAPALSMQSASGIDFLEGEAKITVEDQVFSMADFFDHWQRSRYILLADGTKAVMPGKLIERLQRLVNQDAEGRMHISFFDLPLVSDFIDEKTASQGFLEARSVLEGFNAIDYDKVSPPKISAELREYQKRGFAWLSYLNTHRLGGCLADDMGLGKTIQAIALLTTIHPGADVPSLIVMPKSILVNWQRELERFAPQITAVIHHGIGRKLSDSLTADVLLTTYATVRNDIKELKEQRFSYIILDESQHIKNISSQISRAVMLLTGEHRLALSGTPVENNLAELYSLFRFLNPGMFGSKQLFQNRYGDPVAKHQNQEVFDELKKKIYPFILRRLKGEVLKDLPEKNEQTLYVEMSAAHAKLYERRRQFYQEAVRMQIAREGMAKSSFFLFQAMGELRQLASIPEVRSSSAVRSPKVELLGEYVSETVENGHKALVFANYLEALNLMEAELGRRDIGFLKITGAVRNRAEIVDMFQQQQEYQVLLMTLKTGGVGLNLTAADYVFLFDPWWNSSAERQAVDRVHRIGQTRKVFSYKLITKGTIEEKIMQLQQHKADLVERLIESDGAGMKFLEEDDIDFIFSGSAV